MLTYNINQMAQIKKKLPTLTDEQFITFKEKYANKVIDNVQYEKDKRTQGEDYLYERVLTNLDKLTQEEIYKGFYSIYGENQLFKMFEEVNDTLTTN